MSEKTNQVVQSGDDISVSDALSKGWALLKQDMSTWAGLALVIILPTVVLTAILNSIFDPEEVVNNLSDGSVYTGAFLGGTLGTVLVVAIYQIVISAILFSVYIKVASGTKLEGVSQAFSLGTPKLGKVILASLVVGGLVGLGFVLLIIPGIVALFLLAATVYIVADTDLALGQAMSLSVEYAKQFFVQLFIFGLAIFAISIVVGIVVSFFDELSPVAYSLVSTTANTALQLFAGLSAAVLYLEMKSRFNNNAAKTQTE